MERRTCRELTASEFQSEALAVPNGQAIQFSNTERNSKTQSQQMSICLKIKENATKWPLLILIPRTLCFSFLVPDYANLSLGWYGNKIRL